MKRIEPRSKVCMSCGAPLTPDMRYCISCYRPVTGASVHREAAHGIPTTRRPDPGLVFLPEEHEAIIRRKARQKRIAVSAAVAIVLLTVGSLGLWRQERAGRGARRAMAREDMARRELNMFADALERFKFDVGRYPTSEEGLLGLSRKPFSVKQDETRRLEGWSGPYLDGIYEVDPWGSDYVYQAGGGGESFELFSYGPQGEGSGVVHLRVTSAD